MTIKGSGSRAGSGSWAGFRSGSILLTNGSGSGSRRPKNIWIRRIRIRIRIRNTDSSGWCLSGGKDDRQAAEAGWGYPPVRPPTGDAPAEAGQCQGPGHHPPRHCPHWPPGWGGRGDSSRDAALQFAVQRENACMVHLLARKSNLGIIQPWVIVWFSSLGFRLCLTNFSIFFVLHLKTRWKYGILLGLLLCLNFFYV